MPTLSQCVRTNIIPVTAAARGEMTIDELSVDERRAIWAQEAKRLPELIETRIWDLIDSLSEIEPATDQILKETLADLVTGRLLSYGYRPDNLEEIECIAPELWIAATLDDDLAGMTRKNGESFLDIRVVEGVDELAGKVRPPEVRFGRPTQKKVIMEAITHCASNTGWWRQSPAKRYEGYKRYLRNAGIDPDNEDGFADPTLKKYEGNYKRQNR